jgi:hypothetical protein
MKILVLLNFFRKLAIFLSKITHVTNKNNTIKQINSITNKL